MSQVFNADHVDVLTLIQDLCQPDQLDTMYLSVEHILHFLTYTKAPEDAVAMIIGPGAKYTGYGGLALGVSITAQQSLMHNLIIDLLDPEPLTSLDMVQWALQKVLLVPTELIRKRNGHTVRWPEALVRFVTMLLRKSPKMPIWCASDYATELMTRVSSSVKSQATIIHASVEGVTRIRPNPLTIINAHLSKHIQWSYGKLD